MLKFIIAFLLLATVASGQISADLVSVNNVTAEFELSNAPHVLYVQVGIVYIDIWGLPDVQFTIHRVYGRSPTWDVPLPPHEQLIEWSVRIWPYGGEIGTGRF